MKCLLTARFIYAFTQNYRESGDRCNIFCFSFSFQRLCIRKTEFEYSKATSVLLPHIAVTRAHVIIYTQFMLEWTKSNVATDPTTVHRGSCNVHSNVIKTLFNIILQFLYFIYA